MPNTISPAQLENLQLSDRSKSFTLTRAGWIRSISSGAACSSNVDDVFGCVLYAQIVDWKVMKFGTSSSFKTRMGDNADTINAILRHQDGRDPNPKPWLLDLASGKGDEFKKQAPEVIRSGQSIQVWAVTLFTPRTCQNVTGRKNSRCPACRAVETDFNRQFCTIEHGWAMNES